MKKMVGLLMKWVPIVFLFISGNISQNKETPSLAHIIYMGITILMTWGILEMVTDKNKVPRMSNWTRMADVILLVLFVVTATKDFLHRHDANVTVTNSLLMFFCGTIIYLHEKVRDQRVAKLLEATYPKGKRSIDEPEVKM